MSTWSGAPFLIAAGFAVVPVHWPTEAGCSCRRPGCPSRGKHPIPQDWTSQATTDFDQVAAWADRWPEANIGATGHLVVDLDGPAAVETWRGLYAEHGRVETLMSRTARGWHVVFRQPAEPLGNSAGKIGAGIDTRGVGGCIIAPPSRHASGHVYAWHDQAVPVASCPAWLVDLLRPAAVQPAERPAMAAPAPAANLDRRRHAYVSAAVAAELQRVLDAGEGERNNTLNRAAFALGQLVQTYGLDEAPLSDALQTCAHTVGLGEREALLTIESGLRSGRENPRSATA